MLKRFPVVPFFPLQRRLSTASVLISLALFPFLSVGCATTKEDTQVRYRPEPGEKLPQAYLPENRVNSAVDAEIEREAAAEQGLHNAVGRAELQRAKRYSPATFFANVELTPVKEGKNFVGYRIEKFSPLAQEFLKRFDSVPMLGDILVSINGVRQNNPDDFMKVWDAMDEQNAIVFNLLRGAVEGGDNANVEQVTLTWPVESP